MKITRRDVDSWLAQIEHQIQSIMNGPAGELRARLALLQKRISMWRETLGVVKKDR
jgi:hypothetical protein